MRRRAQACERGFTDPFLRTLRGPGAPKNFHKGAAQERERDGEREKPHVACFCNTAHVLKKTVQDELAPVRT